MIHFDRFPDPVPATIFPDRTIDAVGSSGAGKAMNFASLGWDVVFWTPVGDDEAGDRAVAEVEAMGVEVVRFPDPAGTAEHVNLMDRSGERISIFARTGSPSIEIPVDDVTPLFEGADVLAITQYDYCRPLLEPAGRTDIPVLIDIHDYDGMNPYHRQFYEAADWLFLSSLSLPDWEGFGRARLERGAEFVVATHGEAGASALVDEERFFQPAPTVAEVVDTNGAGDAFSCGFVDGWLESHDPVRALERGAEQAGRALQLPGLAPV